MPQSFAPSRTLDATTPPQPVRPLDAFGDGPGTADPISVTNRWFQRGGRPWFPITGEVHFSRIPRQRWSEVLGHARAGGLTSVATYIFWQAHEPAQGQWHWDDNRDLRAFVELAGRHGLGVIVRMGPWGHGEARNGGFPDWLLALGYANRTNDPRYLDLVRAFYAQIIGQLRGLTHAEGGPVMGAQMDNELYNQPDHLATLREIAEEFGLRVPIWTATGWGGAQLPNTLLPLYSAYSDAFWEETSVEWPPFCEFHYRFQEVRDDLSVGADLRQALDGLTVNGELVSDHSAFPFATCELGGGMHVAYHRRPLVTPRDVSALAANKIASGSVWQGYYMYAGGTQRVGPQGTEQESHATGYPNDVPSLSYDFHAPIGEHGQIRPHHHQLRRQHLWLHLDGSELATMATTVPQSDEDDLRWAVRANSNRGYVFFSTYQPPAHAIASQDQVQVSVQFDRDVLTVPFDPVDLPQGVNVAWPLRFPLTESLVLRSATAQLLTRVDDVVVLSATDGVDVELVLEGGVNARGPITARSIPSAARGQDTLLRLTQDPSATTVIDLPGVRVVVVDEATADQLYVLPLAGRPRLLRSSSPIYVEDEQLITHTCTNVVEIDVFPPLDSLTSGAKVHGPTDAGLWQRWSVRDDSAGRTRVATDAALDAQPVRPTRGGPMDRLSTPSYATAATLELDIPGDATGADRVLLRLEWTGDIGRASVDGEVISDHFWHGRPWDIDLTTSLTASRKVRLELMPWAQATGIWVDPSVRGITDGVHVASAEVIRVARIAMSVTDGSVG